MAMSYALMMEVIQTSETSVNFYETTWCNIPEAAIFIADYCLRMWTGYIWLRIVSSGRPL
jgi:hypothetical protein